MCKQCHKLTSATKHCWRHSADDGVSLSLLHQPQLFLFSFLHCGMRSFILLFRNSSEPVNLEYSWDTRIPLTLWLEWEDAYVDYGADNGIIYSFTVTQHRNKPFSLTSLPAPSKLLQIACFAHIPLTFPIHANVPFKCCYCSLPQLTPYTHHPLYGESCPSCSSGTLNAHVLDPPSMGKRLCIYPVCDLIYLHLVKFCCIISVAILLQKFTA